MCALSASASGVIEVPLRYGTNPDWASTMLHVASVKMADFDMLAPGAKEAPVSIEFGEKDIERGITRMRDDGSAASVRAGKQCRTSREICLDVDDKWVFEGNRSNLHILIEYLDEECTDTRIRLFYDSGTSESRELFRDGGGISPGSTGVWKRMQFRLDEAWMGNRQTARGGDFKGDLKLVALPADVFQAHGSAWLKRVAPDALSAWKLPSAISPQSLCYVGGLGGKQRLFVLDRQNADSTFFDRLLFDANANNDLTDDPVINGAVHQSGDFRQAVFPPVDIRLEENGISLLYRFSVMVYVSGRFEFAGKWSESVLNRLSFRLNPACHYRGEFEVDGTKYQLGLGDANCNGSFVDQATWNKDSNYSNDAIYLAGDMVFLTRDDNLGYDDGLRLGNRLLVGDRLFDVSVRLSEGKLTLTPASVESGTLKLSQPVRKLQLMAPDGSDFVAVFDADREIRIPAGEWRFGEYTIARKDAQGDEWRVSARGRTNSPAARAGASEPQTLQFGEPFTVKASVSEWSIRQVRDQAGNASGKFFSWWPFGSGSSGAKANISLGLTGVAGEELSNIEHTSGSRTRHALSAKSPSRPKEPSYKVFAADGEIVASGSFEYG
jgi:hypothetical protein